MYSNTSPDSCSIIAFFAETVHCNASAHERLLLNILSVADCFCTKCTYARAPKYVDSVNRIDLFVQDGDARLARGCFRERAHELQRGPGADDPAAGDGPHAAPRGHVCAVLPAGQAAAPGRQPREGQDHHPAALRPPQAGRLQQEEAHAHGQPGFHFIVMLMCSRSA